MRLVRCGALRCGPQGSRLGFAALGRPRPGVRGSVSNPRMYSDLAAALGIHHEKVTGELVAGCTTKALGCNLTVGVDSLMAALRNSAAYVRAP